MHRAIKERNEARIKMFEHKTKQTIEEYRQICRRVHTECRKNKRLFEKNRLEELEDMKNINEIRNFYLRAR